MVDNRHPTELCFWASYYEVISFLSIYHRVKLDLIRSDFGFSSPNPTGTTFLLNLGKEYLRLLYWLVCRTKSSFLSALAQ